MVERIFDGTLPLYLVPISTPNSPLVFEGSSLNTSSKGEDNFPSSTSSTLMTFLPLNFWLLPTTDQGLKFHGVDGLVGTSIFNKREEGCVRRLLLVQLERGKTDGQRVVKPFFIFSG